jgi:hypothetical protein
MSDMLVAILLDTLEGEQTADDPLVYPSGSSQPKTMGPPSV